MSLAEPTYTENYDLVKPDQDTEYDVEHFNRNVDIIDAELKKNRNDAEKIIEDMGAINAQTLQAASQNVITNILLVHLNEPYSAWNRPGIVSKETNTSGDFPPGCLWGVREVYWHSARNLTIKVTGAAVDGYNRIWTRSYIDGVGWGKWTEPIGLLLAHKDSGDHDGRYYTESEIDSLLSAINGQIADCLKSVGDGKIVVANAITAQGVSTATDAAFSTLATNIAAAGNARYNTGYSMGVTAADNRANPASNNYKTGYNAGVAAADARVNTSSASYTTGYNNGVAYADNRANPSSNNYKTGYNAGVTAADARVNTSSASYIAGKDAAKITFGTESKTATLPAPAAYGSSSVSFTFTKKVCGLRSFSLSGTDVEPAYVILTKVKWSDKTMTLTFSQPHTVTGKKASVTCVASVYS